MRTERYFHIRPTTMVAAVMDGPHMRLPALQRINSRGGATVRVVGDGDTVEVQVAYCSGKDAFCRKTGREYAASHPIQTYELKGLPNVLGEVAMNVTRNVLKVPRSKRGNHPLNNMDWSFATKYFQPKALTCSC